MPVSPELKTLMNDTVVVYAASTSGTATLSGARATWAATGSTYAARVLIQPEFRRLNDGQHVEVRSVAWVNSTRALTPADKIELPDGTAPAVLQILNYDTSTGFHHSKVEFGR